MLLVLLLLLRCWCFPVLFDGGLQWNGEQKIAAVLLAPAHYVFPLLLLRVLLCFGQSLLDGEQNFRSVRRPGKGVGFQLFCVEGKRFSARGGDDPDALGAFFAAL